MQNDLNKKAEEFNEFMLKQAAITFSNEGIARDLKNFLQKKIQHDEIVLSRVTELYVATVTSESKLIRDSLLKKGNPINQLLTHALKEVRITSVALDITIQDILNKESILASENSQDQPRASAEGEKNGVAE